MSEKLTACRDDRYSATYCPEDDKLRLYVMGNKLPREAYLVLKSRGFKSTPKQDCDFVAVWSCSAEDACYDLIPEYDDIGDEDYSPQERAADRAERFSGYRDRRASDAEDYADVYESGSSAYGFQNSRKAERMAERRDRKKGHALSNWSKAEYWQRRTEGVISNALYKSEAPVRRSRILRLEAELRKAEKSLAERVKAYEAWNKLKDMDGADQPLPMIDGRCDKEKFNQPQRIAWTLVNTQSFGWHYKHPRKDKSSALYYLMEDEEDPVTPREVAELFFDESPLDEENWQIRQINHLRMRLAYERQMLAGQGGTATEEDMIPGGWIGRHQIHKVNRSPATKAIVSVAVMGEQDWYRGDPVLREDGTYGPPIVLKTINIQRLGEGHYRPPTPEELEEFNRKKKEGKVKKETIPLINPTPEDAQRLQDIWNAEAQKSSHKVYGGIKNSEVVTIKQAIYSAYSKGDYSRFSTVSVNENGLPMEYRKGGKAVFKIRKATNNSFYQANSIVVISDKPTKQLPFDKLKLATEETVSQ